MNSEPLILKKYRTLTFSEFRKLLKENVELQKRIKKLKKDIEERNDR